MPALLAMFKLICHDLLNTHSACFTATHQVICRHTYSLCLRMFLNRFCVWLELHLLLDCLLLSLVLSTHSSCWCTSTWPVAT